MAEASIPVDLTNPGQVFACLGFLEAADILCGEAMGGFDWSDERDTRFRLSAAGGENPAARVLAFLERAEVVTKAPAGSETRYRWLPSWGKPPEESLLDEPFPFPAPEKPPTLPIALRDNSDNEIMIEYWGDETRRDNVKFWGGMGGNLGASLTRDALRLMRGYAIDHSKNPFSFCKPQSSSFRFDWRRDYVPIDAGFSPNEHDDRVTMIGYPIVELLAAIGMQNSRPFRRSNLEYTYSVVGVSHEAFNDPIFVRAALGARRAPIPGMPFRLFAMQLAWPGQEGQARCIVNVMEEAQE